MFKRMGILLVCCLILIQGTRQSLPVLAAEESSFQWYCVRNTEHLQPRLDANMEFILQYQGYYVDQKHGDDDADKVVYLTFDAGYENGNVAKILKILKEEQVPGAFFVLAHLMESNPELIIQMSEDGHFICNHTADHIDMTTLHTEVELKEELERTEALCMKLTGKRMQPYLRPPEGKFDETSLRLSSALGYKTIFWSFAYEDWDNGKQLDPVRAKEKILKYMHNGAVILLHPTSETNALILQEVIQELKALGYRFGTLDELTASAPEPR